MLTVAFLRAINVGGHSVVKMADLKQAFEDAGCKNVQTYIQSGNVIFDAPEPDTARVKLFKSIQTKLNKLIGRDVDIIYRTQAELQRIVKSSPFGDFADKHDVKMYVVFAKDKPARKPKLPIVDEKEGIEIAEMLGFDYYLLSYPVGKGRYGVPNLRVEKELGVTGTARNWNTVTKILAKMSGE